MKRVGTSLFADIFRSATGRWRVGFHDVCTPDGVFWPLCDIDFDPVPQNFAKPPDDPDCEGRTAFRVLPSFATVATDSGTSELSPFEKAVRSTLDGDKGLDAAMPSILRELANAFCGSLVRTGLLRPRFESCAIDELASARGAIVIPDTNTLVNGALHYIVRTFASQIGSVALPEDVEKELRSKASDFKGKVDNILKSTRSRANAADGKDGKGKGSSVGGTCIDLLTLRPFAQNGLLGLRRTNLPTAMEIIPIQASSLKAAGGDEEIVRTVAEFLLTRRTSAPVFFVTCDYNLARFCDIRGWKVIFCRQPELPPDMSAYSVRFDCRAGTLTFVDVADLLWDMAYAFNCLEIVSEDGSTHAVLDSCHGGVSFRHWQDNTMALDVQHTAAPVPAVLVSGAAMDAKLHRVSIETFLGSLHDHLFADLRLEVPAWQARLGVVVETARDYLAFGEQLGLWSMAGTMATPTAALAGFRSGWVQDGVDYVRQFLLERYPLFAGFCRAVRDVGQIGLKDKTFLTEHALQVKCRKYFPKACELLCLGRVLTGQGKFIWTGETCETARFASFLGQHLAGIGSDQGTVSIADLVNAAYAELRISHAEFTRLLKEILAQAPDQYEISGSVALPASRSNSFDCLTRATADGFLHRVNLDDGLMIGSRTVKAISLRA